MGFPRKILYYILLGASDMNNRGEKAKKIMKSNNSIPRVFILTASSRFMIVLNVLAEFILR